jgi:hypothetical protein
VGIVASDHEHTGRYAMFVQVIEGRVTDAEQLHAAFDRWEQELAAGADGWLGATEGVTDDGRFIAVVRFESEEAARRNSQRPEQDRWWREVSALFAEPVTFHDSSDVMDDIVGDPDQAGFVQIMQGRGSDPDRARQLMTEDSGEWTKFRPEILGSLAAQYDDGGYTMAMYFTSEEAARAGEKKEPPPQLKAQMDEMNSLMVGEPEFFDLRRPWIYPTH